ncbi:hypothetical protein ACRALDRAFT_1074774 [Sodiomyces alcalophilus JCM 7366]|uniref:uncharacterized protein n=1 Tax=Sodiomyces alcalophilus JCM 7366 TaxID=591952 RepID=UPI0039B6267D
MSAPENPMAPPAPNPKVSKRTILMAGLPCDIYGLEELASAALSEHGVSSGLSCLWLHHPRTRSKEDMGSFAERIMNHWHRRQAQQQPQNQEGSSRRRRGLIAVAFDQRNHGGRMVEERANRAWRNGNPAHAIDMFGGIAGMVTDTQGLMDLVAGYVRMEVEGILQRHDAGRGGGKAEWDVKVDQHLVLGVSLGGHSAWQALFAEERIKAGVVIIGCPDYMALMTNRAKLSKLSTFKTEDDGASFLGSRDFPRDLVRACLRHDPKGILFGTAPIPEATASLSPEEQHRLRGILDKHVRGKKVLVCSGGDDKLVPYAMARPFVEFLENATQTWWSTDGSLAVENIVYEGVGHVFSDGMVEDACRFLLDEVESACVADSSATGPGFGPASEEGRSKI